MLFAAALPMVLGAACVAVDYSSAMRQKAELQSAADAAALNAARELIVSEPTPARVDAIAAHTVASELRNRPQKKAVWQVSTRLADDRKAVIVNIRQEIQPVFGILNKLYGMAGTSAGGGFGEASVSATARLSHNSKLCLLAIGDNKTAISLETNARLTGTNCSIHSNSTNAAGVNLETGAKLYADLLCSRGGIANRGATLQSEVINDCPPVLDPLRSRPAPPVGACTSNARVIYNSGTITLNPGVYCGGLEISGLARVKLNPGIYVFLNGDLTVKNDAQLIGEYVGLFFRGNNAYFRFEDNALVDLVGPKDGAMSGLLLWRDRASNVVDKTAAKVPQKANAITADRARRLTGTIYLPEGSLYIAASAPVAQVSDYTVILVRRLMLADGPNLVLNTNYAASDVPVPQDLGPIGLRNLKLER